MAVCVSGSHTIFMNRSNLKTVAVLSREKKMGVQYDLKKGQSRNFHELPSGLSMEVIVQKGAEINKNVEYPPLVFVHGSYHAAWCWAEHWLPFFSSSGYDCYAVSLLGQGESDAPGDSVAGTLQFITIGHKIQKADATCTKRTGLLVCALGACYEDLFPKLKGAGLVCSVPPSGNSGIVWRYILSKPITAFKVTRSLAAKAFQTSLPLCKETFFSATMEDHVVKRFDVLEPFLHEHFHCNFRWKGDTWLVIVVIRSSQRLRTSLPQSIYTLYQELMKESSRMPLFDLRKLNASLPVPPVSNCPFEILVLGAKDDFIVDVEGLKETAKFYGVSPVCIEAVAHDMMLDVAWERGAEVILSWLNGLEM
ncbi:hypothetical protein V8G54_021665 [Vigna mungo]|uniref:AB hydrolase-1 domain-containing protein n=1 Tax=Vigna mungo TaxID=3915 RepID=A0AAQ3RUH7_VIGMU